MKPARLNWKSWCGAGIIRKAELVYVGSSECSVVGVSAQQEFWCAGRSVVSICTAEILATSPAPIASKLFPRVHHRHIRLLFVCSEPRNRIAQQRYRFRTCPDN